MLTVILWRQLLTGTNGGDSNFKITYKSLTMVQALMVIFIISLILGIFFSKDKLGQTVRLGCLTLIIISVIIILLYHYIWYPKEKAERQKKAQEKVFSHLKQQGYTLDSNGSILSVPRKVNDIDSIQQNHLAKNVKFKESQSHSKNLHFSSVVSEDSLVFSICKQTTVSSDGTKVSNGYEQREIKNLKNSGSVVLSKENFYAELGKLLNRKVTDKLKDDFLYELEKNNNRLKTVVLNYNDKVILNPVAESVIRMLESNIYSGTISEKTLRYLKKPFYCHRAELRED